MATSIITFTRNAIILEYISVLAVALTAKIGVKTVMRAATIV